MSRQRIVVVGQGYVGLPVALRAAAAGYSVVGFDLDEAKVTALQAGRTASVELEGDLIAALAAGQYTPSSDPDDLAGFDIAVVAVPTPLHDGRPDLTAVLEAARAVGRHASRETLVVLESTVAPGTTRGVFAHAVREGAESAAREWPELFAFSPERIDPGNPLWRFENTPKLVGGLDATSTRLAAAFYRDLCVDVVEVADAEVAEMAKLLENTYRHVNIALVNEFAIHAHALGIDVWQVIDAASTKPFGFHTFRPGPGVGGHCLPIDPAYLSDAVAARTGQRFETIELALRVNAAQPDYVVQRAALALNERGLAVRGSDVLLLGVAYKPGSSDVRESPAIPIIAKLQTLGARVRVCDPHVERIGRSDLGAPAVPLASVIDAAKFADLVLLVTDHPEFPYDELAASGAHVLDTRAALPSCPGVIRL